MPSLPPLPDLTQTQYDYLVGVFTRQAASRGLQGPAEAYVRWSLDNLVTLARQAAYDGVQVQLDQLRAQKYAEVETMLSNLIGGAPAAPAPPVSGLVTP